MATKHTDSAPRLGGVLISNQVVAELLEQLRNGIWQDTDHLPPELELANRLNVSRTVVRDALSELERAGYIERVRGIGTVINRDVVNLARRMDQKFEFTQMIRARGMQPNSDDLRVSRHTADADAAQALNISLDTLRPDRFAAMTRLGTLQDVLAGIKAAEAAGFRNLKFDTVLIGGFNDDEIEDFVNLSREHPWEMRFIELMPMGAKTMTFECGMRFLTDYLQGDKYFKIHREGQNLDRCRTQFKLVEDMEQKWYTMNEIVKKYSDN